MPKIELQIYNPASICQILLRSKQVQFTIQSSYHLMQNLLKNSYMVSNTYVQVNILDIVPFVQHFIKRIDRFHRYTAFLFSFDKMVKKWSFSKLKPVNYLLCVLNTIFDFLTQNSWYSFCQLKLKHAIFVFLFEGPRCPQNHQSDHYPILNT